MNVQYPVIFIRQKEDGTLANGSGCGNETASERPMMRKFMIESVLYWMKEYHIDGFRFDLMGVHDIETMNEVRKAVDEVDSTVCVYGEGWAAETPQYPVDSLAMKRMWLYMPELQSFRTNFVTDFAVLFGRKVRELFLPECREGRTALSLVLWELSNIRKYAMIR